MPEKPSPVILTVGTVAGSTQVHHRDFPEIRAEGHNPKEAAAHLLNHLNRAVDSALTDWRRETIARAIRDVEGFCSE
jgi:hypothetical protein